MRERDRQRGGRKSEKGKDRQVEKGEKGKRKSEEGTDRGGNKERAIYKGEIDRNRYKG